MKLVYFLIITFVAVVCGNKLDSIDPICLQPVVQGLCLAYFPRYAYNRRTGKCGKFIYGGCGGNKNNFLTEQECLKACRG